MVTRLRRALAGAGLLLANLHAGPAAAGPALLFDAASGRVLYAEDQDDHWYPASLTKIMTAYVTFDALKAGRITLDQKIKVSEKAHVQAPSKVGLPVGAEMTVDLALRALVVKSANDVAIMLAEAIAGSEEDFVRLMNDTAKRLGMSRTRFVNPNGLPAPEQVTTARDLARLARAVMRDFPAQIPLWGLADVQIGKLRLASHNRLLNAFEGADGIKTGFICDSGYNIVASATRDGRQLMAVVLGDPSGRERNIRTAGLLEHGFQMHAWKQLFNSATLESLPLAANPREVTSVRQTVMGWDCGSRKRPPPVARKKGQPVAGAKDKAKGKAATKAAATGTPATTATTSPPRPKAAAPAPATAAAKAPQ
jgi:D-alanyl-D-alanine carboxypeptidase